MQCMRFAFILCIIITVLGLSCHTSRRSAGGESINLNRSNQYVTKQLRAQQHVHFQDFNGKAKVKYDDGEQRISFATQLRMKKGEYIWIYASFLTYEVARILIRPDSIFAINRLEKSFIANSYEQFNASYEIPASYSQLESMLLGNSVLDFNFPYLFKATDKDYQVMQQMQSVDVVESIDPRRFSTSQVDVTDNRSGYTIEAKYEDFRNGLNQKDFSYFRQYIIKKDNAQVANIQLNFSDIDTNQKRAPFEIPSHYQRAD